MKFNTVLLPTDFSTHADAGCAAGIAMAQRDGAKVIALHVLPLSDLVMGEYPITMVDQLQAELMGDAEQRMQRWKDQQAMAVETLVVWGNPALDICRIAEERKADLIVTSTHGRTGLAHLVMGSVAERVVRHAPCSVLVVRARHA
ncbi:MAG: universal stress protein [Proteobacteria bacterium]|jgi:universal stress protein A|nr:universal stress protein [Pseudomonadota bacterium]MBK8956987.1 universal stress protein [Pseudomonadota bacterium]